jgi:xanthine dehydrogenase YagR molybdenum-binding subunit
MQMMGESRIPLSDDAVHFAGQVLAVVVADSFERARATARLLKVSYAADSPELPEPEPRAEIAEVGQKLPSRGDVEAALKDAAAMIDELYVTPTETHNPMEPCATVAGPVSESTGTTSASSPRSSAARSAARR